MKKTGTDLWADQAAASQRVVLAGIHLITHGFGRLALLPYIGPTGAWRCEFHVQGRPDRVIYRYTAASAHDFLANHAGGKVTRAVSPGRLAAAIMKSVPPHLGDQCAGEPTPETKRWLGQLQLEIDAGRLPFAFHEHSDPRDGWNAFPFGNGPAAVPMPMPPGYVAPNPSVRPWSHDFWVRWYNDGAEIIRELPKVTISPELVYGEVVDEIARQLWLDIQGLDSDDGSMLFKVALEASIASMLPWAKNWHPGGFLTVVREAGLDAVLIDDPRTRGAALALAGKSTVEAGDEAEIDRRLAAAMAGARVGALDERNLALIDEMLRGPVAEQLRLESHFDSQTEGCDQ